MQLQSLCLFCVFDLGGVDLCVCVTVCVEMQNSHSGCFVSHSEKPLHLGVCFQSNELYNESQSHELAKVDFIFKTV